MPNPNYPFYLKNLEDSLTPGEEWIVMRKFPECTCWRIVTGTGFTQEYSRVRSAGPHSAHCKNQYLIEQTRNNNGNVNEIVQPIFNDLKSTSKYKTAPESPGTGLLGTSLTSMPKLRRPQHPAQLNGSPRFDIPLKSSYSGMKQPMRSKKNSSPSTSIPSLMSLEISWPKGIPKPKQYNRPTEFEINASSLVRDLNQHSNDSRYVNEPKLNDKKSDIGYCTCGWCDVSYPEGTKCPMCEI